MKSISVFLWWGAYFIGAFIVQQHLPGVDALVPAFLLSLQERKVWQSVWIFIFCVLIQEGTGSLNFGGAILWYIGQIALFRLSQRFFMAENIVFISMLSVSLGAYHWLLTDLMCSVQGIPLDQSLIIKESIMQAFIIPLIWGVAYFTRPKTAFSS